MHTIGELPHSTLFGAPDEIFYQLGIKDRQHFPLLFHQAKQLCFANKIIISSLFSGGTQWLSRKIFYANPLLHKHIIAYSEGLQRSPYEVMEGLLIPEILSAMGKFIPNLPMHLFGCSTLFAWDQKQQTLMHGRILDFPLQGQYERFERSLLYQMPQCPQIYALSIPGIFYPSPTAMNSEGISLAVHQKFNHTFKMSGSFIHEIAHLILSEGHDKKSVLNILQKVKTFTHWGLYIGFGGSGEVLEVDICADELRLREYQVQEENFLYFNNVPLPPERKTPPSARYPLGQDSYCQMRETACHKKLKKWQGRKQVGPVDLLKVLATPHPYKAASAQHWHLTPLTISSLSIQTMLPKLGEIYYVPGPTPKILEEQVLHISRIWDGPPQKKMLPVSMHVSHKGKAADPLYKKYVQGIRHWSKAEAHLIQEELPEAYHNLQLATDYLREFPETHITHFFFLVLQYMHISKNRELAPLLLEFQRIAPKLPEYLKDHALLLQMRLEIILQGHSHIEATDISHPQLRQLFVQESKLPPLVLKELRRLVVPLMSTLDILYFHQRFLTGLPLQEIKDQWQQLPATIMTILGQLSRGKK